MLKLLVIDPYPDNADNIVQLCGHCAVDAYVATSISEVVFQLDQHHINVVLIEHSLYQSLEARLADKVVAVYSGDPTIRSIVDSMKQGAIDFLSYPFSLEDLSYTIDQLQAHVSSLPNTADTGDEHPVSKIMFGQCAQMRHVFGLIEKVAPTEATVLIQGETGTGKELAARAVHQLSERGNRDYVCINCAAIPETLIESELFGHEKGAFTGAVSARSGLIEAADGGTVFLDEIGELPHEAQARLLRVLQEGEIRRVGSTQSRQVDVRLVAATHRNLKALAKNGKFREDLFYRLNVVPIKLPPLRERGEDLLSLADLLLQKAAKRLGKGAYSLSPDAMRLINQYHWPGNVRELENAMERGCILSPSSVIEPEMINVDMHVEESDIPEGLVQQKNHTVVKPSSSRDLSMEDYFKRFVEENQARMNETELAKNLGISRKNLWEKRQKLGIPRQKAG